jgi:Zn-dependent peptidase ImmA (M78 family)
VVAKPDQNSAAPNINWSLINDLQIRIGTTDLFRWLDNEGERLSTLGIVTGGHVEFTKAILHARNVLAIHEDKLVGNACIRPADDDHYIIYYRRGLPSEVARFAIAHELGHTLWFAPGGGAKPLSPIQFRLGRDLTIEYLCNRFAASLLLPRTRIMKLFQNGYSKETEAGVTLHIIPRVSTEFRIAEQAVARRFFFELSQKSAAILCLRNAAIKSKLSHNPDESVSGRWVTSWCTLPNDSYKREEIPGFRIPLTSQGRLIPLDMIPEIPFGGTHTVSLDGRWWDGIKTKPMSSAKIPFERLARMNAREALASKVGGRLYIMLPLEYDPDKTSEAI